MGALSAILFALGAAALLHIPEDHLVTYAPVPERLDNLGRPALVLFKTAIQLRKKYLEQWEAVATLLQLNREERNRLMKAAEELELPTLSG